MKKNNSLLLIAVTFIFACFGAQNAEAKTRQRHHVKKQKIQSLEEEIIGYYSKGRLKNPSMLPESHDNYYRLFTARARGYGPSVTIKMIVDAAAAINDLYPSGERLQIGDIAAKNGGKISNHNSHRNGLDVDIAYLRMDYREQEVNQHGFDENFVEAGILGTNFDLERNWALFKILVKNNDINRIFVAPEIKHEICEYVSSLGELESEVETLRRLRPYKNHSNHMHIRLNCPKDQIKCKGQVAPEEGTGCQLTLDHDE